MNLEGQSGLTMVIGDPDIDGIVTITIKTFNGVTTLGTITIEGLKLKTWLKAWAEMASSLYPDNMPDLFKSRTEFNVVSKSGTIKFN